VADNSNPSGSPSTSQFENTGIVGRYEYVNTGKSVTSGSLTERYNAFDPLNRGVGANASGGYPELATGVYAAFPAMTPKYARHPSHTTAGRLHSLARMYIPVGSPQAKDQILAALKRRKDTQLAEVADRLLGESSGSENTGKGYIDFILQGVSQSLDEKYQVSEVLEDNYAVFFFGQRAPVWSYSGVLMNTYQDDWTMNMLRLYAELGRGSQLAKRGLLLHLRYDSLIVGGCMLNFRWDLAATNELFTSFTFNFLVRSRTILRGSKNVPTKLPDYYDNFYSAQLNREDASYMATITQAAKDAEINEQEAQMPEATSFDDLSRMTPNQQTISIVSDANARRMDEGFVSAQEARGSGPQTLSASDQDLLDSYKETPPSRDAIMLRGKPVSSNSPMAP